MKSRSSNYYTHPPSTETDTTKTIWYEVKPNNPKKHLRMHDEDINYIHHWLNRFVVDVSAKQFLNPTLYNGGRIVTKELGNSKYKNKELNSILSYASGLVCNRLRNPSQDYTKTQLVPIEKLFHMICHSYDNAFDQDDLGYDIVTKEPNEPPKYVNFKEIK